MDSKKVVILLSTYNGERFLAELLDSIFSQSYPNYSLLVRDDGSSDSTINILQDYCNKHSNLSYYKGENIKPARSFMDLLKNAPDADYYSLCDQDDIWLPDKVEKAVSFMEKEKANLYHSNFQMVNRNLDLIPTTPKKDIRTIGQSAVLITATGCTMMLSRKLRETALLYTPSYMIMHDYWLFQIAVSTCQPICFDVDSHILYRQHGANVLGGISASRWRIWMGRIKSYFHPRREKWHEFKELYTLVEYINAPVFKRIKIAFDPMYKTGLTAKDNLFKWAVILKRF